MEKENPNTSNQSNKDSKEGMEIVSFHESVGSNPTPSATRYSPVPSGINGDVISFLWQCAKNGYRSSTVEGFGKALRDIAKHVDINSPEDVKEYVAKKNVSEDRKEVIVNCYANYCQWKGLKFSCGSRLLPYV